MDLMRIKWVNTCKARHRRTLTTFINSTVLLPATWTLGMLLEPKET